MSPRRRFFYALKKFDEDYHGQIKEIFAAHVRTGREVALNAYRSRYSGSFTLPVVAPAIPLVAPVVGSTIEVIGLGIAGIVTLFSLGKKIKDYNSQSQIHADSKPKILGTPIHGESGPKVLSTPIEAEHGPKVNSTPIHENDRVDEGYDVYNGPSSSTFTTPIPDDINKPNILAKDGEIDLKRNPSHNERDFDRKARALQDLADRGKLRVNRDYKRNSNLTQQYRKRIEKQINIKYKNDPIKRDSMLTKLRKLQVDHLAELQLNGEDISQNMWLLDGEVNGSIGSQIRHQTKDMQHGDKISKINIKD